MKTILTISLLVFLKMAYAQDTLHIQTSAICEMCQYAIEKEMAYEKGVKSADLNLDNKVLTVTYNGKKTDPATIRKRVSLTGYHADDVPRDANAYAALPECCKDGAHGTKEQKPHTAGEHKD